MDFNTALLFNNFPAGPPPAEPVYDRKLQELERTVAQLRSEMSRRGPQPVQQAPPPPAPRQGWATPDYNDMVAAKRKEEARRHRLEDPELYGALISDNDRRFEEQYGEEYEDLDAQLNSQKVQLMSRRDGRSTRRPPLDVFEDNDAWLRVGAIPDIEGSLNNIESRMQVQRQQRNVPGPGTQRRRGPGQSGARGDNGAPFGSLPVGQEERVSAKQRRQSNYRDELQRQMAEQRMAKAKEKQERLAAPAGGQQQPQRVNQQRPSNVQGDVTQLPSMPLQPGLENLPSLSAYNTPADDAYFYYGSKNPLEDALEESLPSQLPQTFQPPPPGPGYPQPPGNAARGDETSRKANRARMQGVSVENPMGAPAGGDPREAERRRKAEYAAELQRQMQEVAKTKEKRKKEQEEFDRKKDAEIAEYFPFESRSGGGGEPIKRNGQVVADLRRQGGATARQGGTTARAEPESFKLQLSGSFGADALGGATRREISEEIEKSDSDADGQPPGSQRTPRAQTNAHGDVTHARGGHGVFGQPKSEEEKAKTDDYKEQLRLQIEERKRQKEAEAEKERLQEEKEQRKIEEQAKKIREEFEEEQRRQKEKREEVNRKNEEMWKEAEAKKKQESDAKRRRTADPADNPPFGKQSARAKSPPIPALRRQKEFTPRARSPPLPTQQRQQRVVQSPSTSRPPLPESSRRESQPDVLRQLERMKKELQTERVKVEDALRGSPPPKGQPADSNRYEVVPTSARGRRSRAEDLDVFELARQGRSGPVVVRTQRPRGDLANTDVLREFRNLKLRDNEVGRNVRHEHPATPMTSDLLEVQQNTYLRQQEQFINDMQRRPVQMERYQTPQHEPPPHAPTRRDPTPRRQTMEDAEIASQYSFDVENLNNRTEERMRRLSRMNADDVSLQNQDAVLESFMRQRTHITNEAEREAERAISVRNRQTSYDQPTHGVKQTSFGGLQQDERTTSYHAPTPVGGVDRPPTVDLESVGSYPDGPTPVDDTWLYPSKRRQVNM